MRHLTGLPARAVKIALAAQGADRALGQARRLQLAAQAADAAVDAAVQRIIPGGGQTQDVVAAERPVGVAGKGGHKVHLGGRQVQHPAPAIGQPPLPAVQRKRAEGQMRPFPPAAQHRLDPCGQIRGRKGLGHIVVGAVFQPFDALVWGIGAGQHDDAHALPRRTRPQAPGDGQTVLARQVPVQQAQVGQRAVGHQPGQGRTVGQGMHSMPAAEDFGQQQAKGGVILDKGKNCHGGAGLLQGGRPRQ